MDYNEYNDDAPVDTGGDTRAHVKLGKMGRNVPNREKRKSFIHFRVSHDELDEFYLYAKSQRRSMSYLIRETLEKAYPEIFVNINRYVQGKSRKKPAPKPPKTHIMRSFDGSNVRVFDTPLGPPLDKPTEEQ